MAAALSHAVIWARRSSGRTLFAMSVRVLSLPEASSAESSTTRPRRSVLIDALGGAVLLWAALPPLQWSALAWFALVPWLSIVQRPVLPGRHPYRDVWIAGFVFWLCAIHWLRLPHPATSLGWVALSFYLAFYLPLFIALSRVAVHEVGLPLTLAAPVLWTGLELAQGHVLTGFLMGSLSHTQYRWPALIQISDLGGAYAVGFLIVLVSASLVDARLFSSQGLRKARLLPGIVGLAATLAYGHFRLAQDTQRPGPTVALIQGSIDADWKRDPGKVQRIFNHYFRLSRKALDNRQHQIDLVVWPETMFPMPWIVGRDGSDQERPMDDNQHVRQLAQVLGVPVLLGIETRRYDGNSFRRYNSAVALDTSGRLLGRYDKMHLVMFGEYVPFAQWFPQLYRLTPLRGGITAGDRPTAIVVDGTRFAPNICFETVLPHVVAGQVRALSRRAEAPDVLVNLTNDAWFWGSSELEMHLACDVFRSVECRRPMLVAANGGISAWIDANGVIRRQAGRRTQEVIVADVALDTRRSIYAWLGDWPSGVCLMACLLIALRPGVQALRARRCGRSWAAP